MNFLKIIEVSQKNILMYFFVINLVTFLIMGYDKHEAKINQWRISEKALFLLCIFGGSIGGILGMYVFRHKTQKWYFKFGFPLIVIIQICIVIYIMLKF